MCGFALGLSNSVWDVDADWLTPQMLCVTAVGQLFQPFSVQRKNCAWTAAWHWLMPLKAGSCMSVAGGGGTACHSFSLLRHARGQFHSGEHRTK